MTASILIGLDYGTASARGVAVDVETGLQVASHTHPYRHGTLTAALPDGTSLPHGFALQVAPDYLEAAEAILSALGRGREVLGIGVGFTASSPLPTRADGTPLSDVRPQDPHAYVKLWRHAAQSQATRISAQGGAHLENFGGRVSGEWFLAKAAQIAEEAPDTWARAERFVEAGDWLVWQLTGREARSLALAAYKAQFRPGAGYPDVGIPGLAARMGPEPLRVGSSAGGLSPAWRMRTGIGGPAAVAVAVIDSHVVLPAIGAVKDGCFVGALGTSAAYLALAHDVRTLPSGMEGMAHDAAVRDLWVIEAGQASFGDTLEWFVRLHPQGSSLGDTFAHHEAAAAALAPGESRLLALDWWGGNRVPLADARLSGMILGLTAATTPGAIYRALLEALCFGARSVLDAVRDGGLPITRVVMTSGLAGRSPLLMRIMADVLGVAVEVPQIDNATAVGAAIHGAVAGGVVATYAEGAARFGAHSARTYDPDPAATAAYALLYARYRRLAADPVIQDAMRLLSAP